MGSWEAHSISLPRLLIMVVDSPNTSLNSLRSLFKLQKPLNPSHFLTPNKTLLFHFVGSFISSPDVPNVLSSFQHTLRPSSHASRSRHKISKGFRKAFLLRHSTLNCRLNSVLFHHILFHCFLGLLWWSGGFHWLGGKGHWLRYAFQSLGRFGKMLNSICYKSRFPTKENFWMKISIT
jgi:hypothetical protein